jgi:ligand-binding SRPBCC domain-containing protein
MPTHRLHRELWVPQPIEAVFEFFSRADNLGRITPAWLDFRMVTPADVEMRAGTLLEYKLRIHGLPVRWRTRIEEWAPPERFVDVQERGPYRLWRHTHRFVASEGGTTVIDDVEYALPFGVLGRLVNRMFVARDVAEIFDYRVEQIASLLPGR